MAILHKKLKNHLVYKIAYRVQYEISIPWYSLTLVCLNRLGSCLQQKFITFWGPSAKRKLFWDCTMDVQYVAPNLRKTQRYAFIEKSTVLCNRYSTQSNSSTVWNKRMVYFFFLKFSPFYLKRISLSEGIK